MVQECGLPGGAPHRSSESFRNQETVVRCQWQQVPASRNNAYAF